MRVILIFRNFRILIIGSPKLKKRYLTKQNNTKQTRDKVNEHNTMLKITFRNKKIDQDGALRNRNHSRKLLQAHPKNAIFGQAALRKIEANAAGSANYHSKNKKPLRSSSTQCNSKWTERRTLRDTSSFGSPCRLPVRVNGGCNLTLRGAG